jgi:protein-disulfide isomerase
MKTLDGTDKTLQDFANKVTLVSFFFPKCPSCNVELPEEQKIYDKYKDKGLSMVWINILPDEEELVAGWEIKRHLTVPVLVGASQDSLERDYRVTATPTNYLLGEKGEVIFRQAGYKLGDEKTLEAKIAQALNVAP